MKEGGFERGSQADGEEDGEGEGCASLWGVYNKGTLAHLAPASLSLSL
jgi:hypothetical protein